MKKICIAAVAIACVSAPAFAADLPMNAPPMIVPAAVYNWTGIYFGAHAGGAWEENSSFELPPGSTSFPSGTVFNTTHPSGFLGGLQGGYNWQVTNFVFGVEGEWSAVDVGTTSVNVSTVNGFVSTSSARTKDIEAVTGRLGYAANNWLIYAKGGGAWSQGGSTGVGTRANGTLFDTDTVSTHRSGWTAGAGFEWGFAPNWSVKLEYDHFDFGNSTLAVFSSRGTTSFESSKLTVEEVKVGVNYRFNWGGPVVANY